MSLVSKLALVVFATLSVGSVGVAHAASGDWYLALGDSLSFSPRGYSTPLAARLQAIDPGIRLKTIELGAANPTLASEAEAFLRANRGHVPLVTIDTGAHLFDACGNLTENSACFAATLATLRENLPKIAAGLTDAAGPQTKFVMMTYPDPALAYFVNGLLPDGPKEAEQGVSLLDAANAALVDGFGPRFLVADVAKAFSTHTTDLVSIPKYGAVPMNVALVCQFWPCGASHLEVHPNLLGSRLMADTFFAAITHKPTPPSNVLPPGVSGSAVVGRRLTETHGAWTNTPMRFKYRWEDCNKSGTHCSAIPGASARTLRLTSSDMGHTMRVREFTSNADGTGRPASSPRTVIVRARR